MPEEVFDQIITKEQCLKLVEKVLKTNQFQLINYSLKPLGGEKKGYLATHLKGAFEIKCREKTQTLNFFMKLKLDENDAVGKLSNDENDVYIRESTFLKLATNDFQVMWAPKFYDYIDNKLIVLEDLSERGFKVADLEEYDLNHCYVGLKALASFHAFSFKFLHDKRLKNSDYSILKEYPYFFMENLFSNETELGRKFVKSTKDSMNYIIEQMQPKNIGQVQVKFNEIFDRMPDEIKPKENKYHVISHGDLWANNIMFSYENNVPKQCCMVDYQILRYLPPTVDLQFFLIVNSPPSLRAKHFRELLEHYYQQLSQELNVFGLDSNNIYPEEIFEKQCADTMGLALTLACSYKSFLLMPRQKMTTYLSDPAHSEEVMYGARTKYIKEELEINHVYKEKIFKEIQEFIDLDGDSEEGEKKGYLSTHLKGAFDIKCRQKTQTLNFFMKLKLDENDAVGKLSNDENDIYVRESAFLKLATNDFQVMWAPKFYDFIDNKLIVLEDLSERGFKVADLEEYDLNHCYVGLKALASFHAFSFKLLHDKLKWRAIENSDYSILKEYPFFFMEILFSNEMELGRKFLKSTKDSINCIFEQMQPKNVDQIQEKFNEIFDRMPDEIKPKENKYHVISHGDLWANNIMFSYENNVPKQCCMVDFQILRYLPPTVDLQFFLIVNFSPSLRAKHYRELLEYYYQQLSQELNVFGLDSNNIYPEEIFEKQYADTMVLTMTLACLYKVFLLMPRMSTYLSDPGHSQEVMYGNRAKYIKKELEINHNI
ncbi:uncharacterized protein LOC123301129 [Chrysoperla carnea]|uniref:uncharacterized protein LOC123301129 n=1 Tax=Chrysoperla carnea TaxID=189513 RepID=UPI001D069F45|nr:uncharacterized protein LOC123301129 [Chrysoperla carnea]